MADEICKKCKYWLSQKDHLKECLIKYGYGKEIADKFMDSGLCRRFPFPIANVKMPENCKAIETFPDWTCGEFTPNG